MPIRADFWRASAGALLLATPAAADRGLGQSPILARDTSLSVALVISGGASLGVYEAGYTYVLGEVLKRQGLPLRVVTGASAGSGNALFAAVNSCTAANDVPTADPGYRFWLAASFEGLFQPEASTPVSMFTAEPGLAELRRLRAIWRDGLPASCDVRVGIPVTRVTPLDVRITGRLTAPRQLLHFAVRIRGRGPGRPPVIENVIDPVSRSPQLLLPLSPNPDASGAAEGDLDRLLRVIVASGAFPFAFPPVRLEYCLHDRADPELDPTPRCDPAEDNDLFIDGGVFDNVPLRLASSLGRAGARPGEKVLYIYIDPDLHAYPLPEIAGAPRPPADAIDFGSRIARGFVGQARKTELFALLETDPGALDEVLFASNRYPPASGFLGNFFGLFEEEFRRFDYYLGMYDALADLASWDGLPSSRGRDELETSFPTRDWRPLACLQSWYAADSTGTEPGCASDDLRDLRVLAQVSVNRVYELCRRLSAEQQSQPIAHPHCRRAIQNLSPPPIIGGDSLDAEVTRRRLKESEFDYNMRLLGLYRFHFKDLGLAPEQAAGARRILARRIRSVVQTFAARQPMAWQRRLVRLATLGTADVIDYEAPGSWRYFVVGTAQELGASYHVPALPGWIRLNGAFRIEGLVSLVTQDPDQFAAGLFVGPDLEVWPLTRRTHMVTLGGRIGYQLSQGDGFGGDRCAAGRTRGDGRNCSQVVTQGVVALTAIERVRLQTTLDYFPRKSDFDDRSYEVHLAFGLQF